jgi:transcriptional regulator with XRE-family HTH domain
VDMHIDSRRIRSERERRAWSQEQLAEVAGVALRTIQRVETSGAGSYETAKAIAAVFEVDVSDLRSAVEPAPRLSRRARYLSGAAAASVLVAIGAFLARDAVASEIALAVTLSLNGTELGRHQLVVDEGKDSEIRMEGQARVILSSVINTDGSVAVSMRVYEFANQQFALVSTPKLFVRDNDEATVNVTSVQGNVFRIAVKPHKV